MKRYDDEDTIKCIGGILFLLAIGIVWLFYTPPERKPKEPKPPRTETFSHKVGDATRQTSAEFLRGFFGMDSKLKKEQERLEKEKKQVDEIQK